MVNGAATSSVRIAGAGVGSKDRKEANAVAGLIDMAQRQRTEAATTITRDTFARQAYATDMGQTEQQAESAVFEITKAVIEMYASSNAPSLSKQKDTLEAAYQAVRTAVSTRSLSQDAARTAYSAYETLTKQMESATGMKSQAAMLRSIMLMLYQYLINRNLNKNTYVNIGPQSGQQGGQQDDGEDDGEETGPALTATSALLYPAGQQSAGRALENGDAEDELDLEEAELAAESSMPLTSGPGERPDTINRYFSVQTPATVLSLARTPAATGSVYNRRDGSLPHPTANVDGNEPGLGGTNPVQRVAGNRGVRISDRQSQTQVKPTAYVLQQPAGEDWQSGPAATQQPDITNALHNLQSAAGVSLMSTGARLRPKASASAARSATPAADMEFEPGLARGVQSGSLTPATGVTSAAGAATLPVDVVDTLRSVAKTPKARADLLELYVLQRNTEAQKTVKRLTTARDGRDDDEQQQDAEGMEETDEEFQARLAAAKNRRQQEKDAEIARAKGQLITHRQVEQAKAALASEDSQAISQNSVMQGFAQWLMGYRGTSAPQAETAGQPAAKPAKTPQTSRKALFREDGESDEASFAPGAGLAARVDDDPELSVGDMADLTAYVSRLYADVEARAEESSARGEAVTASTVPQSLDTLLQMQATLQKSARKLRAEERGGATPAAQQRQIAEVSDALHKVDALVALTSQGAAAAELAAEPEAEPEAEPAAEPEAAPNAKQATLLQLAQAKVDMAQAAWNQAIENKLPGAQRAPLTRALNKAKAELDALGKSAAPAAQTAGAPAGQTAGASATAWNQEAAREAAAELLPAYGLNPARATTWSFNTGNAGRIAEEAFLTFMMRRHQGQIPTSDKSRQQAMDDFITKHSETLQRLLGVAKEQVKPRLKKVTGYGRYTSGAGMDDQQLAMGARTLSTLAGKRQRDGMGYSPSHKQGRVRGVGSVVDMQAATMRNMAPALDNVYHPEHREAVPGGSAGDDNQGKQPWAALGGAPLDPLQYLPRAGMFGLSASRPEEGGMEAGWKARKFRPRGGKITEKGQQKFSKLVNL
jgi:hypothetical protein